MITKRRSSKERRFPFKCHILKLKFRRISRFLLIKLIRQTKQNKKESDLKLSYITSNVETKKESKLKREWESF